MSNPTTPFSWQMPTATDLVTDLPADFEVFGQAVATDFQYLLGGTAGQVLSKTSGTDLDFAWIEQDDSNAIQNAIVTAKGDLIGASASATPLVIAVGADGTTLVADSAEATGLKWATPSGFGTWATYTPVLTASTTNPTLGSGSISAARYVQNGKVVTAVAFFNFGTTGFAAGSGDLRVSLPVTATAYTQSYGMGTGAFVDVSAANAYILLPQVEATTYCTFRVQAGGYGAFTAANPATLGASDQLHLFFTYEVA